MSTALDYKSILTDSITLDMKGVSSFEYNQKHNLLTDNVAWNTNLHAGVSTALTYQMNDSLSFGANMNVAYDLGSKNDKQTFGTGLNVTYTPNDTGLKLGAGINYNQVTNSVNTKNDKQTVGLTTNVDFDKNSSLNATYEFNLDPEKPNRFHLGFKHKF